MVNISSLGASATSEQCGNQHELPGSLPWSSNRQDEQGDCCMLCNHVTLVTCWKMLVDAAAPYSLLTFCSEDTHNCFLANDAQRNIEQNSVTVKLRTTFFQTFNNEE